MKIKPILTVAAALSVLATGAFATTVNEIGDAGDLLSTAQVIGAGTTSITGTLNSTTDYADMFLFGWGGGALTIGTPTATIDPQLFLFDSSGLGVAANDDGGLGLLSLLTFANLGAGSYFLAITDYDQDPVSPGGLIFPSSPFSTQFGPTGPGGGSTLTGWNLNSVGGGTYEIGFSSAVAPVPLPAGGLLLLAGLGGLALARRRKV